jgi:hypothetical protein
MVQEIITLTIVFLAAAYTIFSLVKSFAKKESGGCNSSCGCGGKKELHGLLIKNYKQGKFH